MSLAVTLTLDEETGAYLERIAADQGCSPADVVTWIVTEDLRRERAIDAEILAHVSDAVPAARQRSPESHDAVEEPIRRARARA